MLRSIIISAAFVSLSSYAVNQQNQMEQFCEQQAPLLRCKEIYSKPTVQTDIKSAKFQYRKYKLLTTCYNLDMDQNTEISELRKGFDQLKEVPCSKINYFEGSEQWRPEQGCSKGNAQNQDFLGQQAADSTLSVQVMNQATEPLVIENDSRSINVTEERKEVTTRNYTWTQTTTTKEWEEGHDLSDIFNQDYIYTEFLYACDGDNNNSAQQN